MSEKNLRYLAWGIGSIITLLILFLGEGQFSKHGLFSSGIKHTIVFDFFENLSRKLGAASIHDHIWGYLMWYLTLASGIFVSWKLRHKVAGLLNKFIRKVDDNI